MQKRVLRTGNFSGQMIMKILWGWARRDKIIAFYLGGIALMLGLLFAGLLLALFSEPQLPVPARNGVTRQNGTLTSTNGSPVPFQLNQGHDVAPPPPLVSRSENPEALSTATPSKR